MEREPQRLEAFSDGVLAVIITIMALGLQAPARATLHDLRGEVPHLLVYALSFAFIGIYWNNHHHLLRATERISAGVMWANLHLLFWLSLMPVLTDWMGQHSTAKLPASVYGVVAFASAVAYTILVVMIVRCNGPDSAVARGIGSDAKGRLSLVLYLAGIFLAWVSPYIAYGLYIAVSLIWFIPDRRLDERGSQPEPA